MDAPTRSDAMWWAEVAPSCDDPKTTLTHPTAIRKAHREAVKDTPPSPDLALEAPQKLTASIEQVAPQAKKINKLASMAERGEGQERAY